MNTTRLTSSALVALDVITYLVVFNIVAYFRATTLADHLILRPLFRPIAIILFAIYLIDGYKTRTDMMSVDYTSLHSIALIGAMGATLLYTFAFISSGNELQSSRIVIALSFLILIPLTLGYRRVIYQRTLEARGERSLVFLGDHASCMAFRDECRKMGTTQRVIFSVVTVESALPFDPSQGLELLPFQVVLEEVQQGRVTVEAIVLRESARELSSEISRRLVQLYFQGVPTYTLELFHQVYWRKIPLYRLNQTWLFQEGFQIAREPVFERLKRASDIALALFGLFIGVRESPTGRIPGGGERAGGRPATGFCRRGNGGAAG